MNCLIPPEKMTIIEEILKKGNSVELKRVNGQLQIIEIQRKIKERVTLTTG